MLPSTLAVVFLILVIGLALGVLATSNLQLASYEANREAALEVARAGLNQYLYDLDNQPPPSSGLIITTVRSFNVSLLSRIRPLPATRTPYAIPGSRLPGVCYLTFNTQLPYYSVDNLAGSAETVGWNGRKVPPYCLDLISTGVVNGVEKHIEVMISRRWDYALSTPCPIDIGGTQSGSTHLPSVITGDVFTEATYSSSAGPIINVGRLPTASGGWDYSNSNGISGYLRVKNKKTEPPPVYVEPNRNNAIAGTKYGSTESVYPPVTLPADSATNGWTDLAVAFSAANKAQNNGAWLSPYPDPDDPTRTCYAIESDSTTEPRAFTLPGGSYRLDGALVGKRADGTASTASELVLDNANLKVVGDVRFSDSPKRVFGDKSLLWATGDVTFKDGFIDGGENGMVLYARSLTTRAGGCLNGLVFVEREVSMEPYDTTLTSGSVAATLFNTLRLRSLSSEISGSYIESGERRVAGMYIRGGVFTPKNSSVTPTTRFTFRSVNLAWDPFYLKALHEYADRKVCFWQEIP